MFNVVSYNKTLIIICFFALSFGFGLERFDDLHSSITALEEAFRTEELYIQNSEIFLQYSSRILNALRSKLHELKNSKTVNNTNKDTLEKKLRWQYRLNTISESNYLDFAKNISSFSKSHKFPTDIDLEGVTKAINRLQDVYKFSAKEIASGDFLQGVPNKQQLTSPDCFLIGYKLFSIGKKDKAEEWFSLAYDLYDRSQKESDNELTLKKPFHISIILDFLAHTKFRFDDIMHTEMAIEIIKEAIIENPDYKHLHTQLESYDKVLSIYLDKQRINFNQEYENFKITCRGQQKKSSALLKKLYCTYKYGNHPFLKIAPIKVEIQNIDPYVIVFHDVISEEEIEILKSLSRNSLARATVWNGTKSTMSHIRTGKHSWLFEDLHPSFKILNQRLEDMTDMKMETSETLQVMNYGIGGHYNIHPDYMDEPNENNKMQPYAMYSWGNRIATVLFYMSDVEQGGATVFPHINVVVEPKKGTAAFWFNMLPSGVPDHKVRHAACPVIFGSKWVANKWIRYNGQIFQRQCTKNKNDFYNVFAEI